MEMALFAVSQSPLPPPVLVIVPVPVPIPALVVASILTNLTPPSNVDPPRLSVLRNGEGRPPPLAE